MIDNQGIMPDNKKLTTNGENRSFRMHPALLWSVIQSQAGTPEKALLEAIMNAVDAGATFCEVSIDEKGYLVRDDGRGFQSRTEIEEFFETFGTPHKEGDATYGKFRMGRGQLFAFSTTVWRSGAFSMAVDIKNRGLSYDLQSDLESTLGCTIAGTWYERVDLAEVIRIAHDLSQLAQWMQISILVNGKKINKAPAEQEWSMETDDAYIATKSAGGLAVYNLGALVRIYPPHQFGLSGTIVSKNRLQVNFARNDILLSECQVWKRIRRELDKMCGKLTKKKTLYDFERDAIAHRFARGEIPYAEVSSIGLVKDVSGNKRSLRELANAEKLCVAPDQKDWTIGERVMNQKLAFVLNSQTLHRFNVETPQELVNLLKLRTNISDADSRRIESLQKVKEDLRCQLDSMREADRKISVDNNDEYRALADEQNEVYLRIERIKDDYPYRDTFDLIKVVELADVSAHISDRYELLEESSLSPHQKAMLKALQQASEAIVRKINIRRYKSLSKDEKQAIRMQRYGTKPSYEIAQRRVIVGKSDVAEAWTDGESFIAVDIEVISAVLKGNRSVSALAALMTHEYCHVEPDIGGHVHSPDFYELFHEYMCDEWGMELVRYFLLKGYAKGIAELGKKPNAILAREIKSDTKSMGDMLDQVEQMANAELQE